MLTKEIKLNKYVVTILLLFYVITIGLYASYAYYEVSVIKNEVVVIQTATIDITTNVVDQENNTFTIPANSNITVTVNLTTELTNEIGYKMYYEVISGISTFNATSTTTFTNDIVEANMTSSNQLQFTFTNLGSNDITIKLGTKGGLANYPIPLDEGLELKLNETLGVPVKNAITTSVNNPSDSSCKTKVEEDGITYISGTKDCINFNYVWYSGKLWRITAIYPDGTMKMITDDVITTISYGSNVNFYTDNENKSYIYQWLNEDFLDTLYNYENIIVTDSKWNATNSNASSTSEISNKLPETTMVTAPVGLLNSYEYYMSYKNTSSGSGYLNIGYFWWLLNPYSTSLVWIVRHNSYSDFFSPSDTYGGRPSVNLKSGIQLSGGSGTKTDPYTILGDKEEVTAGTTLLNTRSSGEYVKFNNELYRIVSIKNNITKINKNDYVRDTSNTVLKKQFSESVIYGGGTTPAYWDYYLNNTWYNSLDTSYQNMIVESTYYIGTASYGTSYKNSICATASDTVTTKDCEKTTSTWIGKVGLPRYGEMFASQQGSGYITSSVMWLMNSGDNSEVWLVNPEGSGYYYGPSNTYGGRPSVNLKSNIKITGGNGTKENPFEISE